MAFRDESDFARAWRALIASIAKRVEDLATTDRAFVASRVSDLMRLTRKVDADTFLWARWLVRKTLRDAGHPELFDEARFDKIARDVQAMLRQQVTQLEGEAKRRLEAIVKPYGKESERAIREKLKKALPKTVVINGREYDPEQYAKLVAHSAASEAKKQGVLTVVGRMGDDLVQVTENASLVGDFCDAYRGRVFSVSGTDPRFPHLARTPNNGPPFHPWCYHQLVRWTGSEEDALAKGTVETRWLLRSPGEDWRRIQKAWEREHGRRKRAA